MKASIAKSSQIAVKPTRNGSAATLFTKSLNPKDPYTTVEREGKHVADPYGVAGGSHALAVQPYEARRSQRGGVTARAHHTRVPQPFVDALTVRM